MKILTKPKIVKLVNIFILTFFFSGTVYCQSIEELSEIAQQKREKSFDQLEKSMQQLRSTMEELKLLERKFQQQRLNHKNSADSEFRVRNAYHAWPTEGQFISNQDYIITIDFLNPNHNAKLQDQMNQWIEKGWFIQKSETRHFAETRADELLLRLVR